MEPRGVAGDVVTLVCAVSNKVDLAEVGRPAFWLVSTTGEAIAAACDWFTLQRRSGPPDSLETESQNGRSGWNAFKSIEKRRLLSSRFTRGQVSRHGFHSDRRCPKRNTGV